MTIRFSQPPQLADDVLRDGVTRMHQPPDGVSLLTAPADERAAWKEPHQVYHLGLDSIRGRRGLDAAEPVAWRYISDTGAAPSFAADVEVGPGEVDFGGLHESPFVSAFSEEVERAGADPSLSERDFEPRLLDVPGAYVVALWLHEPTAQHDLFIPLAPANRAMQPGRRYSRAEFEAALAEAATNVGRSRAADDGEQGSEAP